MSGQDQHYEPYPPPQEHLPVPVTYVAAPLTDQQVPSTPVVVVSWVLTVLGAFYLLPWAIAASRGKANQWAVLLVSFFLGWTIVGWVVALVMACTAHRPLVAGPVLGYAALPPAPPAGVPAGWYPDPYGPGRRYWDGYAWTGYDS